MENYTDYMSYVKPEWAPPGYLFGIIWPILYTLIFISYGYVFIQIFKKKLPLYFAIPFMVNLLANGLFTYIRFRQDNLLLWFIDIIVVLATIIITMVIMWNKVRRIAYMQIPYLLWVGFATVLAGWIFFMN